MDHQDWEPVILRKPVTVIHKPKPRGPKPLEDGEEFNVAKVSPELKKALQQARVANKMSQKQLATLLNVPVQEITKYETGKIIPNNQFISRMERALGTKLPRCKKPPKKKDDV